MIKKTLTLALLSIAAISNAATFNMLHPFHKASVVKTKNSPAKIENYTNFTGTWNGTCSYDGYEVESEDLIIYNTASEVSINGVLYDLNGGVTSESLTNRDESTFMHENMRWNDAHSTLILNGNYSNMEYSETAVLESGLNHASLAMVDGKLIFQGDVTLYPNTVPDSGTHHYQCTLNKIA